MFPILWLLLVRFLWSYLRRFISSCAGIGRSGWWYWCYWRTWTKGKFCFFLRFVGFEPSGTWPSCRREPRELAGCTTRTILFFVSSWNMLLFNKKKKKRIIKSSRIVHGKGWPSWPQHINCSFCLIGWWGRAKKKKKRWRKQLFACVILRFVDLSVCCWWKSFSCSNSFFGE